MADTVSFTTATLGVISGVASSAFTLGVTWTALSGRVRRLEEMQEQQRKDIEAINTDRAVKITEWRLDQNVNTGRFARIETNLDHIAETLGRVADKVGAFR